MKLDPLLLKILGITLLLIGIILLPFLLLFLIAAFNLSP